MGKIVHDVVDEVAAANPERQIHVETRGAESGEWDQARIAQALSNLIGNAVEHGADGTPVKVDIVGGDREVAISIHNGGPAIPADRLNGIFNPMKGAPKAEGSTAGPTGGLGMGLYIAERIVHAHDGRIGIESSDAGGTTFTVHLPRHG
jgi:signal transduction histidine kinase